MDFQNENTYLRAVSEGKGEWFHSRYEEAVEKLREEFGKTHPSYIAGKERFSSSTFPDVSPSDTSLILGHFQRGSRKDAKDAIRAAKLAFQDWSSLGWQERVGIFRRAADIVSERKFELAALMSFENGKNRLEAMADIDEGADLIRWYCQQMAVNDGYEREMVRIFPNERTKSVLKPYGVWSVVAPFNFPFAIAGGMTTGAVLTGNTAVLKPASDTPFMGLKLYEILREAGLPDGVLNFVTGPGNQVGAELVENEDVAGFVFTGSRDVGLSSFKTFTRDFAKPVITELGGKNATIVTDKADIDKAAEAVGKAAYGYGGQKCSACSRVYVHKKVKEEFTKKLIAWTEEQKIGDPTLRDTYLGPVINSQTYDSYQTYCRSAKRDGKILTGGKVLKEGKLSRGYFVAPTVVDKLPRKHKLFQQELFVPILCMGTISSLDEGLELTNDSEYGLTSGIFSQDETEIEKFFSRIEAGVSYSNRTMGSTTGAMVGAQPFVGWKHSGISGKGAGGLYYLQQFMREQSQSRYL